MTARRSLESRVTRWFAATLVLLYGLVAVGVWASSRQNGRQYAMLALKTEAEAVAAYVAASGRLDAPELAEVEREPFPIWIRVTDAERVLAETPGSPDPPKHPPESTEDVVYWSPPGARDPMLVLRHAVGGAATGLGEALTVHAIGDLTAVRGLERRLGAGLLVLAVLMIPFATWIGRLVSRRALAPISGLVEEIRALPSDHAQRRLSVPGAAVVEVAVLADAFNDVLGRLESNLETMRRFTEDASHEIRNPLAVLRTGIEVLLRHDRPPADYRTLLVENLEEIQRLQSILDGLLLLARAEPGRDPLQRQRLDLARVAVETAAKFSVVAAERRSPIVVEAPEGVEVEADARLVQLVFFNLLDNALKHGREGRPIAVSVRREEGGARIAVTSAGEPIPVESRERLFERYDRPSASVRSGGVGGLGLSVVRWAAEAHGGRAIYRPADDANRFEVSLPG